MLGAEEHLLYVISAKQEVSWQVFKEVLDYFLIQQSAASEKIAPRRYSILRSLAALGHCDYDFNEAGKVYAAPPVLARLPWSGLPKAVLAGARSPQMLDKLVFICKRSAHIDLQINQQSEEPELLPCRVFIEAESLEGLALIAEQIGIRFIAQPPAWSILNFAASLDDYLSHLKWLGNQNLNHEVVNFDTNLLNFCSSQDNELSNEYQLIRNIDSRGRYVYFLWHCSSRTRVDLDWGRLAVLAGAGLRHLFIYDRSQFLLAIPASTPLPYLYERILVLCSGYRATTVSKETLKLEHPETWKFNLYRDVPEQIASLVANKLGQTLQMQTIDVYLE